MENVKTCSRCRIEKPVSCFTRSKSARDGFHCQCKECRRIYALAHIEQTRAYQQANSEKIKARTKEYNRRYKSENREYLRQMDRLRRQKIKAKAARDVVKTDPQQLKPTDANNNNQLSLINA